MFQIRTTSAGFFLDMNLARCVGTCPSWLSGTSPLKPRCLPGTESRSLRATVTAKGLVGDVLQAPRAVPGVARPREQRSACQASPPLDGEPGSTWSRIV